MSTTVGLRNPRRETHCCDPTSGVPIHDNSIKNDGWTTSGVPIHHHSMKNDGSNDLDRSHRFKCLLQREQPVERVDA